MNLRYLRYDLEKTQKVGFPEMIKALIARKLKYDTPSANDEELLKRAETLYSTILRDAIDFCNSDIMQEKTAKLSCPDETSASLKDKLRA